MNKFFSKIVKIFLNFNIKKNNLDIFTLLINNSC